MAKINLPKEFETDFGKAEIRQLIEDIPEDRIPEVSKKLKRILHNPEKEIGKKYAMSNLPMVKLELNNMKLAINHALYSYHEEIEEIVDAMIEKAINEFDFEKEISLAVKIEIDKHIHERVFDELINKKKKIFTEKLDKFLENTEV